MSVQIITTADGSNSLLNTELNEPYHSVHGAIQESRHVFIKNGLEYWSRKNTSKEIQILEIGFGTGLNAFLTVAYATDSKFQIHYTSLEAYPIEEKTALQLNYPSLVDLDGAKTFFDNLHSSGWNMEEPIANNFILEKQNIRLQEADIGRTVVDVVYFDAFSPENQPELWEVSMLQKVEQSMKPGAVFVTYCAKGQLKRDLKSLGLIVETLPGPPGKREMVRALKLHG